MFLNVSQQVKTNKTVSTISLITYLEASLTFQLLLRPSNKSTLIYIFMFVYIYI